MMRQKLKLIPVMLVIVLTAGYLVMLPGHAQDTPSLPDIMETMSQANQQYEQIHVRYTVERGDSTQQHEVWLDATNGQFRHEISGEAGLEQIRVSDNAFVYTNPGPAGEPMTLKASPGDNTDNHIANRMLGGIGTMISPVLLVENRLAASQVTQQGLETVELDYIDDPLNVVVLRAQLPGFPPVEYRVDIETGIIVQEVIYEEDGSVLSTTTLEHIRINPTLAQSLFAVDESQYDEDALREIFPPVATQESE